MIVEARINVSCLPGPLWAALTDIEDAARIVRGIERVEVLQRPERGLQGLRWRETRLFGGKPAAVEKTIVESVEGERYTTRAESEGFVFLTTLRIEASGPGLTLIGVHESRPQGRLAGIFKAPLLHLFRGALRKAIVADLEDYKADAEAR